MLGNFIEAHQTSIVDFACEKMREDRGFLGDDVQHAVAAFVELLREELQSGRSEPRDVAASIGKRVGGKLANRVDDAGTVVLPFGVVCQAVTLKAMEAQIELAPRDVHVMNLMIDQASAAGAHAFLEATLAQNNATTAERLGEIAHELRNGLAAAVFAFHTLNRDHLAIGSRTGVVLGRALSRLQGIVDRTLSEVRLGAESALRRRHERVAHLVLEVREGLQGSATERGIDLNVHADLALEANVDRHLFVSALSNLLQNAIKYTHVGGRVQLRAKEEGGFLVLEVEDECGGLPSGKAEDMFLPFVQRSDDRSGLGLGLTIARKAADAHGGSLAVENLPGRGCIFRLSVPSAPPLEN